MSAIAVAPPTSQNAAEFRHLLQLYRQRRPRTVLEIGVDVGGTLYHWVRNASREATIVAVDLEHRERRSYDEWAADGVNVFPIRGDSRNPIVARAIASYAPFDWIFIDADHHADAVRSDWLTYSQLAAPGAVVALHDVKPSPDPTIEVDGLWSELEDEHDTILIDAGQGSPGIGVVFLPADLEEFLGR